MAGKYNHFSLTVIIRNQELRLGPTSEQSTQTSNVTAPWHNSPDPLKWNQPALGNHTQSAIVERFSRDNGNPLAWEQTQLLDELLGLTGDRKALAKLLHHPNPKVRTLALGALFQRMDGRDLPLIASLINDTASTFPDLHNSMSQVLEPEPLSSYETPQTVGQVAQAMLGYWGVPHDGHVLLSAGLGERAIVTSGDFTDYWRKYTGRDYSASWFMVKMKHATRQTTPIQPKCNAEIRRVLREMRALPMPDRAWTELYVLAPDGWIEFEKSDLVSTDADLVLMIKRLGHKSLLRFLQRQKISADPDLLIDKDDHNFIRMSNFILRHADELLRPEDSDALLACEYVEHESGGINPAWPIGAALVKPSRASEILRAALAHETRSYEGAGGALAGALWCICGKTELDFLVNWFYATPSAPGEPVHQPVEFLWEVETVARRPDTKQLIAALVKDPHFEQAGYDILAELLKIVNEGRSTPLVSGIDIISAQPNGPMDQRMILPAWRNALRREYGFPEFPMPAAETTTEHLLTKSVWSASVTDEMTPLKKSQVLTSHDGTQIAVLTDRAVTIWEAASGKLLWKMPFGNTQAVAFRNDGHLVRYDRVNFGVLTAWDVVKQTEDREIGLKGAPSSGVWDSSPAFDREALRLCFGGYPGIICHDTQTGNTLWVHNGDTGVYCLTTMSSDGKLLAVGGGSESKKTIRLFDATTGTPLRQWSGFSAEVITVVLSPDGSHLATATASDGVQIWETSTGKLLKTLAYQVSRGMSCPAFSPDGRWLAVAGASEQIEQGRVGIFDVESSKLECEIQIKTDAASGCGIPLTFSPDGRFLYTGASKLEAWSVPTP